MAGAATRTSLTEEQQSAVDVIDVGVALRAGAGCGKTSVLTERFLSHLTAPGTASGAEAEAPRAATARLGRLVALTFTERAAREMRDRIRRRVRERLLTASSEDEAELWLAILRRLEGAQISTIHSFCSTLLRRHAVEAGLDPQFGHLEPNESRTLQAELIEDELRRRLAAKDPVLLDLALDYGLPTVQEVVTFFLENRYRIDFASWSTKTPDDLTTAWVKYHREAVLPDVIDALRTSPELTATLRLIAEAPPPHETFIERCRVIAAAAEQLKSATHANFGELVGTIRETAYIKGGPASAWKGHDDLKTLYKKAFEDLRAALDKLKSITQFTAASCRRAAECSLQLLAIAAPIAEQYEAAKRDRAVLDFDDLLVKTRELLCDPEHVEVRRRLAAGIERLLVDECQDTDPLQKDLIDALLGDDETRRKLFLVGDFKQSIYRFRRADPTIFNNWQDVTHQDGRRRLGTNFRSQPEIITFANMLFRDYFGAEEDLQAKRPQQTPTPAIEFLWATPGPEQLAGDDDAGGAATFDYDARTVEPLRRAEAEWLARRIRALVDSRRPLIPEKNAQGDVQLRPAEFGDFAVLFRALSDADIYEKAFDRNGVPYYVVGGKAFYGQQEVYDLLHFLQAVESNCDDVALAGVLRSPFFSLRDDTLFLLAQHSGSLATGLFAQPLAKDLSADERRRAEFAAAVLTDLRAVKNRLPIAGLLNEILARTAYDAVLTGDFLGERKLANLRKLVEMARKFDESGAFTLSDFIRRLRDDVAQQPDEAPAAILAEKSPVVRIMSIHQSKGLEFPIVIVPDLERRANNARGAAAYDPELGPAVKAPDDDGASGLDLFRFVERRKDEEESIRLFYVAVTRARDLLILSSGVKPEESPPSGWRAFLGKRFDLTTGEAIVAAPPGEPRPGVAVTMTIPPKPRDVEQAARRPNWPKVIERAEREAPRNDDPQVRAMLAPIAPRAESKRRFSFSRLSGRLVDAADDVERLAETAASTIAADDDAPDDDEPTGLKGATLGTLVHGVLATLDFARKRSPNDDEIERVVRRQALRLQERADLRIIDKYQSEAAAMVRDFLKSPRARDIATAKNIYRELEFLMSWPPDAAPTPGGAYLQGFLDCLYEDARGKLHLVDYKTHRYATRNVAVAAEPYRGQLGVYALAAERILGRAPDELVICFLRTGEEHVVSWNEALRKSVVDFISSEIANSPR